MVTGIGKRVLAARRHNGQGAECKQQAGNAPLQYLVCALLNYYLWTVLALIASWVQLLEMWISA